MGKHIAICTITPLLSTYIQMVSFLQSNAVVMAALLALSPSTEAAYGRVYIGTSRPSMALGSRRLPTHSRPSLFSRDIRRTFQDMDEMFDSMLGDIDAMFYEPLSLQRMSRPLSYLLEGKPTTTNALAQGTKPKSALGITQDDKQVQFEVEVPGAKASDINLQLNEDGRVLTISGETKREEGGISVHSRFEKSFTLGRDVDTSQIMAKMEHGTLTITAPKNEEVKESVRKIEVTEEKTVGSDATLAAKEETVESDQDTTPVDGENVIDLDERTCLRNG